MPLTVPKSTEPWVGVEVSPRFCSTSEPWQKTLTNSPRWNTPTSCRCWRSSSVVAALSSGRKGGCQTFQVRPQILTGGTCSVWRGQKRKGWLKPFQKNGKKKKVWHVYESKWSITDKKNKQSRKTWRGGKGQSDRVNGKQGEEKRREEEKCNTQIKVKCFEQPNLM